MAPGSPLTTVMEELAARIKALDIVIDAIEKRIEQEQ